MNRRLPLFFVLLFTCFSFTQAQVSHLTKYTVEDGLSHHQIRWVYQDSKGVMWIGAINGINRFDGTGFRLVAKHDFYGFDEVKIFEDQEGDLWIISGKKNKWNHPILFNIHSEKIKTFEEKFGRDVSFESKDITDGSILKDGTLLIGLKTGSIVFYDLIQKKEIKRIETGLTRFRCIASSEDNNFWVISKNGKAKDPNNPKSTEVYYVEKDKPIRHLKSFPRHWTFEWGISDDHKLIMGDGEFINQIASSGEVSRESIAEFSHNHLHFTHSRKSAIAFSQGQYWMISNSSVFTRLNNKKNSFQKLFENKKLEVSAFYHAYVKDDFLWIGTIDGLFKINLKASRFQRALYTNPSIFTQKDFYSCRGIGSDKEGNVYVAASYIIYQLNGTKPILNDLGGTKALLYDDDNNLWFGAVNIIGKFNLETKKLKTYPLKRMDNVNGAWALYRDTSQRLWISPSSSLKYLEKGSDQIKDFKKYNEIADFEKENINTYSFFQDQQGRIWLTTSKGLFLLDLEKGLLGRYWQQGQGKLFLPASDFRHMYQDENGIFWIASQEGLIRWDEKKNESKLFNSGHGFLNNQLYAVYEDDYGFLWISSDNGIIQFEKSSYRVKTFLPSDGISHREFNRISHHQTADGTIYFGGLNGVTYFHPKDFYQSFDQQPEIELTLSACHFFSEKTNEKEDQLATLNDLGQVTMHPGDKYLELEFALLDYENPKEIQYAYAINPKNLHSEQGWNITKKNSINIGFLPYGEHHLVIKGKTANGRYSSKMLTIPINVIKPFYLKTWFIILTAIALLSLVFIYQYLKTRQLKLRQKQLEEVVEARTATIQSQKKDLQALNEVKSQFLANISHEFRTPLTLILNNLSEENTVKLAKEFDKPGLKYFYEKDIQIIHRNANRLHHLIDQLLDLSKLESGKLNLAASKQDFYSYLKDLVNAFTPLARKKNIDLEFDANTDQLELYFDREKMDKVFYNLLSNAIKFTPNDGSVIVDLQLNDKEAFININDTGIGIPDKDLPFIFNRFYRVKRQDEYAFEGTGIGLALTKEMLTLHYGSINVESEQGAGTCFQVRLPLGNAHLKEEEIANPLYADPFLKKISTNTETEVVNKFAFSLGKDLVEKPTLLIIEDNEDLLFHQQKSFKKDYQLLTAKNGIQGVEVAIDHIPDIIICDVMMPGKDGYEVCADLKNHELTDHIPIILLTAKATHEEKLEGLSVGADSYLTKPYNQKELALTLKNKLELIKSIQSKYKLTKKHPSNNSGFNLTQSPFVAKIIEIIDENITNANFGVEELAHILKLSRSQLFRKLKALTGETPAIFIRRYRLEKARLLLESFEGNPSEIAYQVGFSSPNYFYKCFKKEYGITPTELIN